MKLLYVADSHFRKSIPSCRIDSDFYGNQLAKLKRVCVLARQHQVDYVLHGGDLFDESDTPLQLINDVMDILKDARLKWIVNPGNHDIFGANLATLTRSGLGILWKAGVIDIGCGIETRELDKSVVLRMIPYMMSVDPALYQFTAYDHSKIHIIMTHDMLTTFPVPFQHTELKNVNTNADLVLCSHWHSQFKERPNTTTFINPGPLVRQTVNEVNQKPSVCLINTNPASVQFLEVKHEPASKVIKIPEVQSPMNETATQFLQTVASASFEKVDRQQLVRKVGEQLKCKESVIEAALGRVVEAETALEVGK